MVNTISEAFVEQFRDIVFHKYQQNGSRLQETVYYEPLTGEVHNFEVLAPVTAVWKTTDSNPYGPYDRHKDTPILDAPHSRRRVSPTDAEWGDLVDREDKLRLIISPESNYARAGSNALGRATDDLIILAFNGDATDGSGTPVTYPAGNVIAEGGAGLTFDKVNEALERMNLAEVDDDDDRWFCVNSKGVRHLMNQEKPTSTDYVATHALMEGKIVNGWMGFNWKRSERLPIATTIRSCFAYHRMSMGLAVNEDMFTRIAERADKSFAHQVYCRLTKGATRILDEGVYQVDFDEALLPA